MCVPIINRTLLLARSPAELRVMRDFCADRLSKAQTQDSVQFWTAFRNEVDAALSAVENKDAS